MTPPMTEQQLRERLRAKSDVDPVTDCWTWRGWKTGGVGRARYGKTMVNGKAQAAHRLSYELFNGPIPTAMTVDHICFNTLCVNPEHLQILTLAENQQRRRHVLANECRSGHPLTPENTYWRPDRPGSRWCRTCAAERAERDRRRRASMDREKVPHGTQNGYATYRCRCAECRAAKAATMRAYRQRRAAS